MQTESARALSTIQATNNNIYQFNKKAHHNSQNWYSAGCGWQGDCGSGCPGTSQEGQDC